VPHGATEFGADGELWNGLVVTYREYSPESVFEFNASTNTITGYRGSGGNVSIPSSIGGVAVRTIGDNAFRNRTNITGVTIPNSVTSIRRGAFEGTGITSITIPNSVTFIGNYAFANTGLRSIVIPNSVDVIPIGLVSNCADLESAIIPNSVTSISDYAFFETGLTSITIPRSVTSIGNHAFNQSRNLYNVRFESATPPTTVASNAFHAVSPNARAIVPHGATEFGADGELWNGLVVTIAQSTVRRGHITGGETITAADLTYLRHYLVGREGYPYNPAMDVDGDGVVSVADLIFLRRALMGIPFYADALGMELAQLSVLN
jgi:hypothetical protein